MTAASIAAQTHGRPCDNRPAGRRTKAGRKCTKSSGDQSEQDSDDQGGVRVDGKSAADLVQELADRLRGDAELDMLEVVGPTPTVAEIVNRYLEIGRTRDGRPMMESTRRTYAKRLRVVEQTELPDGRVLGDVHVGELGRDMARWLHADIGDHRGATTADNVLVLLRAAFGQAVDDELVSADLPNPWAKIRRADKRRRFVFSRRWPREALAAIAEMEAAGEVDTTTARFYGFAVSTGARCWIDVLPMRWEHVDLEEKTWTIPKSKGECLRQVALEGAALQIMKVMEKARSEGKDYVWASSTGGCLAERTLMNRWPRVREGLGEAGLSIADADGHPITPHGLRHAFATAALGDAGLSLGMVGALLGHSNERTTRRYAHIGVEHTRAAQRRVAETIGGVESMSEIEFGLNASRLANVLKKLGSAKVAKATGVTQSAVRQWRAGSTSPSHEALHRIAHMAGVPVGDFYGRVET